ncbi:2-oxoglutarate ferredoxin oxidoreductase subunit beta [Anaerosolibacter carboniphilus]|uniref:2-oxoglutarate ferredoxin oxidoreductase subunit beta n=1 Tax=Anaerosolibacter carboniphilus TaxID=1417629 RepID=A0A841L2V2_9FIRM|nr:2-oxoacid:ferredoxin oxidoreductase subunit beta [Anaerosolibacter carboniphilus]MBB6216675.1 2-oxoglutarate ferredoxin oxidoreductase subunit beta [Anaerosolibacter carboniphilus]
MSSQLVQQYYRADKLPHIWCPGCGHGILMRSVSQAIHNLGLDKDKVCIVSGIGCSSRAPGYMDFNTLHTTHGRALAFATGVKMARPELEVIVVTGDGDASAIGGNHLIHAARRNINITTIVFNNNVYGMTGGQYSPTTPNGDLGTTAPYGNIDKSFDIAALAGAAGATYTARGTAYHAQQLIKLVENAIQNKGFSLIDTISICPTYYGRKNKKGSAVDMMNWLKDHAIDVKAAQKLPPEKLEGKFLIGEFKNVAEPEYTEEYQKIIERFQKER